MLVLNQKQLRIVANYLYDGEPAVAHLMSQIRAFKRGDEVLVWFMKNNIRGKHFVDFFRDKANDGLNHGVLLGVQSVLATIDRENLYEKNNVKKMYSKDLL
jgi:hypothetical protein